MQENLTLKIELGVECLETFFNTQGNFTLDSHSSYNIIPNLEDFRGIYYLKESLICCSVLPREVHTLKLCVDMGQDWIDFEKFRWSLICSYIIVVEMHEIAD
jgi:hypothetical protein